MDDATATDNCGEVSIKCQARRAGAAQVSTITHVHGDGRLWQQHISYADDYGSRHDGT